MSDFLSFRTMITPYVIQILFWIGVIACVVVGGGMIASGKDSPLGAGASSTAGLLVIVVGPVLVRMYCELMIVLFRIHGSLVSIEKQGEHSIPA